ncbi:hypothetical protein BHF33_03725 [Escherichia coli]|nr:hypothetical protein BHF33_03725 [Escherichia coli]
MKLFYLRVSDSLLAWRKDVSRRFQRDAETGNPLPEKRAFNKERVMMKHVIILVILLVISFQAY